MNKHLLRNGLMFSTLRAITIALPTAYANEGSGVRRLRRKYR